MHKDEQMIKLFEVFDKEIIQLEFLKSLYDVYCDMKEEIRKYVSLR